MLSLILVLQALAIPMAGPVALDILGGTEGLDLRQESWQGLFADWRICF